MMTPFASLTYLIHSSPTLTVYLYSSRGTHSLSWAIRVLRRESPSHDMDRDDERLSWGLPITSSRGMGDWLRRMVSSINSLACTMLSYPGPVIWTSLSRAPGTTLEMKVSDFVCYLFGQLMILEVVQIIYWSFISFYWPLEWDDSFCELFNHMNSATLESHHLAAVRVPDDDLVLEVVLAGYLGRLVELPAGPHHLPRQQQAGPGAWQGRGEVWGVGVQTREQSSIQQNNNWRS